MFSSPVEQATMSPSEIHAAFIERFLAYSAKGLLEPILPVKPVSPLLEPLLAAAPTGTSSKEIQEAFSERFQKYAPRLFLNPVEKKSVLSIINVGGLQSLQAIKRIDDWEEPIELKHLAVGSAISKLTVLMESPTFHEKASPEEVLELFKNILAHGIAGSYSYLSGINSALSSLMEQMPDKAARDERNGILQASPKAPLLKRIVQNFRKPPPFLLSFVRKFTNHEEYLAKVEGACETFQSLENSPAYPAISRAIEKLTQLMDNPTFCEKVSPEDVADLFAEILEQGVCVAQPSDRNLCGVSTALAFLMEQRPDKVVNYLEQCILDIPSSDPFFKRLVKKFTHDKNYTLTQNLMVAFKQADNTFLSFLVPRSLRDLTPALAVSTILEKTGVKKECLTSNVGMGFGKTKAFILASLWNFSHHTKIPIAAFRKAKPEVPNWLTTLDPSVSHEVTFSPTRLMLTQKGSSFTEQHWSNLHKIMIPANPEYSELNCEVKESTYGYQHTISLPLREFLASYRGDIQCHAITAPQAESNSSAKKDLGKCDRRPSQP